MKSTATKVIISIVTAMAVTLSSAFAQKAEPNATKPSTVNVLEMKAVPAGNYYLNLHVDGQERHINIKVNDDKAECVNSSDPRLKGLKGEFQLIGNGVFMISLHNNNHRATQFWLFRPEGNAIVKEIPDRGEKQLAQPVANTAIDRPKKTG